MLTWRSFKEGTYIYEMGKHWYNHELAEGIEHV